MALVPGTFRRARPPGQMTWHPGSNPGEGQREEGTVPRRIRKNLSLDSAQKLVMLLLSAAELGVQLIDAISHVH